MAVLDEEQLRLFLGEAKRSSRYYRLHLMAATTGLRQSELYGLKWENVDLPTAQLSVQTVFYRIGGRQIWKQPKSKTSQRSVTLHPELVKELRALKREQDERRKEVGSHYQDHNLVFAQDNGRPLHAHNVVRRDFHRVLSLDNLRGKLRAQGIREESLPKSLPAITFHGLRHSRHAAPEGRDTHEGDAEHLGPLDYRDHHGPLFPRAAGDA